MSFTFDINPPASKRFHFGWVALYVLVGLAAFLQLLSFLSPKGTTPLMGPLKSYISDKGSAMGEPNVTQEQRYLSRKRFEGLNYARNNVVYKRELLQPIDQSDLAPLWDSGNPSDHALYRIYASKTLTRDQASKLIDQLQHGNRLGKGETGDLGKVAAIHAQELANDSSGREKFGKRDKIGDSRFLAAGTAVMVGCFLIGLPLLIVRLNRPDGLVIAGMGGQSVDEGGADRLAMLGAAIFLSFFIVGAVTVDGLKALNVSEAIADAAGETAAVGVALLAIYCSQQSVGLGFRKIGAKLGSWRDFEVAPLLTSGMFIASIAGAALMAALFPGLAPTAHPLDETLRASHNGLTLMLVGLSAAVLAPIFEELLFRGVLLTAMDRVIKSPGWAIALNSFMFASIHPQGPASWFSLGSVGAVLCLMRRWTGSIYPCMLAHGLYNLALLLFGFYYT